MGNAIRILNVTTALRAAGIESFIINNYRRIDRDKVQFDFLVMRNKNEYYDAEVKMLGGEKFTIETTLKNSFLKALQESYKLYQFLKKHKVYKIVHIHYTTPLKVFYLLAAKKAGVKVRIYHSHSAEISGKSGYKYIIYELCRKRMKSWGTYFFACSKAAAKWMYPDEMISSGRVEIIKNGIDTERFRFSEESRKKIRTEYNLEDSFIVINTGRFTEQKNQKFSIKMFSELKKSKRNAVLMLLGDGDLLDDCKKYAYSLGCDDVIFLGVKNNVEEYLSAADCYVMPSLYEGLPVAAIEAQCSGLPCILSKNITDEVAISEKVLFLPIDDVAYWVDAVEKVQTVNRHSSWKDVIKKGYDINDIAKKLEKKYFKLWEK